MMRITLMKDNDDLVNDDDDDDDDDNDNNDHEHDDVYITLMSER